MAVAERQRHTASDQNDTLSDQSSTRSDQRNASRPPAPSGCDAGVAAGLAALSLCGSRSSDCSGGGGCSADSGGRSALKDELSALSLDAKWAPDGATTKAAAALCTAALCAEGIEGKDKNGRGRHLNAGDAWYLLNPGGDLARTQAQFQERFAAQPGWRVRTRSGFDDCSMKSANKTFRLHLLSGKIQDFESRNDDAVMLTTLLPSLSQGNDASYMKTQLLCLCHQQEL